MIGNILGIIYWKFFFQFDSVLLNSQAFKDSQAMELQFLLLFMYFLVKKYYNAPTLDLRPNSNSSCGAILLD
jgi:hypothetical protein